MRQGFVPGRIRTRTIVLTAASMLCFSANSILCRLALVQGETDPGTFTTLRVFSAGLMLGLMVYLERRRSAIP